MTRRFGEQVEPHRRYQLRPGVYAILRRGDLILLTHQSSPVPELQLPGGGIDPGEQPITALHREVYEETGWTMRLHRRLGAFRRFCFMPEYDLWAEKLCTIYLAQPVRSHGPPTDAGHFPVWLSLRDAADALGNPGDAHFVSGLV